LPESSVWALEPEGGNILKRYETIFITPVDLNDDEIQKVIERYGTIIKKMKGMMVKIDKWGKRKLAYAIRKHANGFYLLMDYASESSVVKELERNLKIDDRVLKYITVKTADTVDVQELEKEIEAAKKRETEAAPSVSKDKPVKDDSEGNAIHEIGVKAGRAVAYEKSEKDAKGVEE
jgi:small subunit ribosomal protein S6